MKVAFPDRLHGHQHRTLDDAVFQGRDTQCAFLAIGFRDIDADSDDAAHLFRSDRAHRSDLMPPGWGADRVVLFTCDFGIGQLAAGCC